MSDRNAKQLPRIGDRVRDNSGRRGDIVKVIPGEINRSNTLYCVDWDKGRRDWLAVDDIEVILTHPLNRP